MTDFLAQSRQILDEFLAKSPRHPLIAIIGPTASGKTAFSVILAESLKELGKMAEVVNADSRQFYRGFDVGTAKITEEEKRNIPHHLIDVLDPHEDCTIAWYKAEATRVIADIHARGGIPILVGGSMLYTAAVIDGLEPLPPADPMIRKRLEEEYDRDGGTSLFARLSEIDPEAAASFPMQNKVYVVRAMEIYESTGKTKSEQLKKTPSSCELLLFGMDVDRNALAQKIAARTKHMLDRGWIEEVRGLRERGVQLSDPAMKSVGYREIFTFLDAPQSSASLEGLSRMIEAQTRAYAKRHMTWWKRDQRVRWITP